MLSVEVLHGWQLHPSDVLCSFHHPLQNLTVEGGATAIPGGDAASQDTGEHVEPSQPVEEEEPLSC